MPIKNLDSSYESKDLNIENIIIGSGAGGSTTAFELFKQKKECVILEDGPNVGPGGVMSLNGDLADMQAGVTGADISAAERGETPKGMTENQARGFRAGAISAGARVKGTDDLQTLAEANSLE